MNNPVEEVTKFGKDHFLHPFLDPLVLASPLLVPLAVGSCAEGDIGSCAEGDMFELYQNVSCVCFYICNQVDSHTKIKFTINYSEREKKEFGRKSECGVLG